MHRIAWNGKASLIRFYLVLGSFSVIAPHHPYPRCTTFIMLWSIIISANSITILREEQVDSFLPL